MPASTMPARAALPSPRQAMRHGLRASAPALTLAACVVGAVVALWPSAASIGRHMLLHVLAMSALAPLVVAALRWLRARPWRATPRQLWLATALQLALFLCWHAPAGMSYAMHAAHGEVLLQGSLLFAALLFWWCVAGLAAARTWHAIAALLLTGKVFCLVAIVMTFAPRALYHMMTLADQQLAGLIMITLCPMTYIAGALWLCRRWLLRFDAPAHAP